jgi:hypothetical protein
VVGGLRLGEHDVSDACSAFFDPAFLLRCIVKASQSTGRGLSATDLHQARKLGRALGSRGLRDHVRYDLRQMSDRTALRPAASRSSFDSMGGTRCAAIR